MKINWAYVWCAMYFYAVGLGCIFIYPQDKPAPSTPTSVLHFLPADQKAEAMQGYIDQLQAGNAVQQFLSTNPQYTNLLGQWQAAQAQMGKLQAKFCFKYGPNFRLVNDAGEDRKQWACVEPTTMSPVGVTPNGKK